MTYTYTAYELVLRVPFHCPVLRPAPEDAVPDIIVGEGSVPHRLATPLAEGKMWQAEPDRFLWRGGPRAGRVFGESGPGVTPERNTAAEEALFEYSFDGLRDGARSDKECGKPPIKDGGRGNLSRTSIV